MRFCRAPRKKLFRLLSVGFTSKFDLSCLNVTCITVVIMLIVTIYTTSSRPPTVITSVSKYEVDIDQIQKEAIDTIVIEQPDGSAYVAFQIPGSSKLVSAIRNGRLTFGNKDNKEGSSLKERKTQEVANIKEFDNRYPISVRDNPYEINNENVCKNVKNLEFVVLVHSATSNFMRRSSIRETWANYRIFKKHSMRIIFLLGIPEQDSTQVLIEHENSLHNDIIQGRFLDTYHNLTHKGVLGIRWISEFCPESRTVVKVDDDVFVNVFKLMDDVINVYSKVSRKIYCPVREKGTSLIQRHEGKWKIGDSDFKNMTHYPVTYCNGFFTIFTAELAPEMFEAAKTTPFFWIDDVYIYGLLPDKLANVTFTKLPNLNLNEKASVQCFESRNKTCDLLVATAHSDGVMDKLWYRALEQYRELAKVYSREELF